MHIRILAPEEAQLCREDLARLFPSRLLTPLRCRRIAESPRVVAECGHRIVGLASYRRVDHELHVHDFCVEQKGQCLEEEIVASLLESLELACLAGGGRRIVITDTAVADRACIGRHGYITINEGCAGRWLEKTFA